MQIINVNTYAQPTSNIYFRHNNTNTGKDNMKLLTGVSLVTAVATSGIAIYKTKDAKKELKNVADKLKASEKQVTEADEKLKTMQDELKQKLQKLEDTIKENTKLKSDLKKKPTYKTIVVKEPIQVNEETVLDVHTAPKTKFMVLTNVKTSLINCYVKLKHLFLKANEQNFIAKAKNTENVFEKGGVKVRNFVKNKFEQFQLKLAEKYSEFKLWKKKRADLKTREDELKLLTDRKETKTVSEPTIQKDENSDLLKNEGQSEIVKTETVNDKISTDVQLGEVIDNKTLKEQGKDDAEISQNSVVSGIKQQGEVKEYLKEKWKNIKDTVSQMYKDFKDSLKPEAETTPRKNDIVNDTNDVLKSESINEPTVTTDDKSIIQPLGVAGKWKEFFTKIKTRFVNNTHHKDNKNVKKNQTLPPLRPEEEPPKWVKKFNDFVESFFKPDNEDI